MTTSQLPGADPVFQPRTIERSSLLRYSVAIGAAGAALLIRLALNPFWADRLPFITFFPAIVLSAWYGGLWPGLLTTGLSAAAVLFYWLEPVGSLTGSDAADWLGLAVFVAIGAVISALNESLRTYAADRSRLHETALAAQRQTEIAREQLSVALEAGGLGTWEYSLRTGVVTWSAGLEAIHGFEPGTFAGTFDAFRNEIFPADRDRVLQAIERAVAERRSHHVEYRIVRPDGAIRWVEGRGEIFFDAAGRPDRMVGVCSDITDRRQAEAARTAANERFGRVVEAAPAAMFMVDPHGTIVLANALTERLLGCDRSAIVGQSVDQFVPEAARAQHARYRAEFHGSARARPMGAGRDLSARRSDGTAVPVEVGLSPIEIDGAVYVLATVTDITERKRVERERTELLAREQEAHAEMARANRLKDEFLAVLSHELRTPLSSVLGYAHLLEAGALSAEQTAHAVTVIRRNADAQVRLVDSLLDLSRVMAGRLDLDVERVDLRDVVTAALDVTRPAAAAGGLTIDVALPDAAIWIEGDAGRLQQVFWNLLSNAIKFTPHGGRIALSATACDGEARVTVSDTGQGIRADFLPHVFDRFAQANARGLASRGLGLGLALVSEIVQAHGGCVKASSPGEGAGSTFEVRLPARDHRASGQTI